MKTLLGHVASICLAFVTLVPASAQITITANDMNSALSPGNTIASRQDTSTRTANIGVLGATSWDFSSIVTNFTATSMTVRPDTTPHYSNFPNSTHGYKVGTIYGYYTLGTDLLLLGAGYSSPFEVLLKNNPSQILYQLPMTLGTSWTSTYEETSTIVSLGFTTVTNYVRNNTVDAYGPMTLPGGGTYEALRLRVDTRATTGGGNVRSIMYYFIAKNGAQVFVAAADTNQPNTGTIRVSNMSWNGPIGGATAVGETSERRLPSSFALEQNYPNPFNPSTTIEFDLPRSSHVKLVVVNVLGENVATLVDRQLPQGRYTERFDVGNLPSGVYFYKLQAPEMSLVKKMMLLR